MEQIQYQFSNKVAFVTGASTGIGRATALEFAKHGAKVAVVDVNDDAALYTVKKIEEMGSKAIFIKCDVSNSSQVKASIDKTVSTFGRIDFAYNNAGIEGAQSLTADTTEENWDRVIDINLKGIWLCMKYQIPIMLKQGGGSIVNCASIAGLVGFQGIAPYDASKHGVIGLTQTAALEYAKQNIRINAVCPGVIKTPMIDRFTKGSAEVEKQFAASEPIGRLGQPEEIASAVMWLSSGASSFVTGQALAVDGGWVAQ
jgi:NAD(P)-dependent dehydrogenase (short-subunit alcohol dehydrogenase family)